MTGPVVGPCASAAQARAREDLWLWPGHGCRPRPRRACGPVEVPRASGWPSPVRRHRRSGRGAPILGAAHREAGTPGDARCVVVERPRLRAGERACRLWAGRDGGGGRARRPGRTGCSSGRCLGTGRAGGFAARRVGRARGRLSRRRLRRARARAVPDRGRGARGRGAARRQARGPTGRAGPGAVRGRVKAREASDGSAVGLRPPSREPRSLLAQRGAGRTRGVWPGTLAGRGWRAAPSRCVSAARAHCTRPVRGPRDARAEPGNGCARCTRRACRGRCRGLGAGSTRTPGRSAVHVLRDRFVREVIAVPAGCAGRWPGPRDIHRVEGRDGSPGGVSVGRAVGRAEAPGKPARRARRLLTRPSPVSGRRSRPATAGGACQGRHARACGPVGVEPRPPGAIGFAVRARRNPGVRVTGAVAGGDEGFAGAGRTAWVIRCPAHAQPAAQVEGVPDRSKSRVANRSSRSRPSPRGPCRARGGCAPDRARLPGPRAVVFARAGEALFAGRFCLSRRLPSFPDPSRGRLWSSLRDRTGARLRAGVRAHAGSPRHAGVLPSGVLSRAAAAGLGGAAGLGAAGWRVPGVAVRAMSVSSASRCHSNACSVSVWRRSVRPPVSPGVRCFVVAWTCGLGRAPACA